MKKTHKRKQKKIFKVLTLLILVPLLMIGLINAIIYFSPDYNAYKAYTMEVKDTDGKPIYSSHFYGYGAYIKLTTIPEHFIKCLLISEDQSFYTHHGFDYGRIAKSFFNNLSRGEINEGGSTITQQYARTVFLNNDKTFIRKMKEAFIARKLEMTYTKDQILEGYINSAYFGHNLYGIDEAAYYFYGKNPAELTLSESAMLVGVLSSPNNYSPQNDLLKAISKQESILKRLYLEGKISSLEYDKAIQENIVFNFQKKVPLLKSLPYYQNAIVDNLNKLGFYTEDNRRAGIEVETYLDLEITSKVQQIIEQQTFDGNTDCAVVVMEPNSGKVLCLIGGKNYLESEYNRALYSYRQTGSAIKPLLYYLALESGMTPLTKMDSKPTTFYIDEIGSYSPKNSGDKYANGPITMLEAIALSDNIYATKTTLLVGSHMLKNALEKFGATNIEANPTIGLGTNTLTPLCLTSIYNTFASEGEYYPPRFIKSVTLSSNRQLYSRQGFAPSFSLDQQKVTTLNYMLRSPFDPAFVSYATPSLMNYRPNSRFAAKTGSTETDSWVVGFNPQYTIGVYVGTEENQELKNGALSKILFKQIADSLMEHHPDTFYSVGTKLKPFYLTNSVTGQNSYTYYH